MNIRSAFVIMGITLSAYLPLHALEPVPSSHFHDAGSYSILTFDQISSDMIADFAAGKYPELILECSKKTRLPFKFMLNGNLARLDGIDELLTIEVLSTFYIKLEDNAFFFSEDLQIWKNPLDFFTGGVGLTLGVLDSQPSLQLNADINIRPTGDLEIK